MRDQKRNAAIWGIIIFITLLAIGFILWNYTVTSKNQKSLISAVGLQDPPQIEVEPKTFDFGDLVSKDAVEKNFFVKNTGKAPLIISGISTSCGCTTAVFVQNGQKTRFGMHGNPINWQAQIEPNDEAELVVRFDPDFHKGTKGEVIREIYIKTNDPQNPEYTIRITANVV